MGKLRAVAVAVVLSATASGCWLQSGFNASKAGDNAGESTVTQANVDDLQEAWTADVGTAAQEALIRSGTAYVRSDGAVTALDVDTGEVRWTVTETGPEGGTPRPLLGTAMPAIVEGTLQVPMSGPVCALVGLDLATGDFISAEIYSPPFLPPTWSYGCAAGDVLEVNGAAAMPYNWGGSGGTPGPPCDDTGEVMRWGVWQGIGVGDLAGNVGWEGVRDSPSGCGPLPGGLPQYGPASVSGDEVLVPKGTAVQAYPLSGCPTGTTCPTWSVGVGATIVGPPVALVNGDVAVAANLGALGSVYVVDGTTHSASWSSEPIDRVAAAVAATDRTVYVSLSSGLTGGFTYEGCGGPDCGSNWGFMVPGGSSGVRPSIGGNVLYAGGRDGIVVAVPADECPSGPCPTLWSHDTGSPISGAASIVDGTLLVGSADGTVSAFRLPD